jgi:hypothetical protein
MTHELTSGESGHPEDGPFSGPGYTMWPGIHRWIGLPLVAGFACTSGPWEHPQHSRPEAHEQCKAAGGITEPSFLGDRCILILPQPRGVAGRCRLHESGVQTTSVSRAPNASEMKLARYSPVLTS